MLVLCLIYRGVRLALWPTLFWGGKYGQGITLHGRCCGLLFNIQACTHAGLIGRVLTCEGDRKLKDRLTLTIDRDVILAAQGHARSVGVPLSSLVEGLLRAMIGNKQATFAARWRGSLKVVERDEPRFQALKHKYLT